ncbi:MAG: histidine ammonia-lyase [Candidatus Thermoplasmatota archaeon]|nr:histidine ammonia-lyase [Candidatus Thermoplasmatota archaeon]
MITLNGKSLTLKELWKISMHNEGVRISQHSYSDVRKSREELEKILSSGSSFYGVNTGFGSLWNKRIDDADLLQLQEHLIMSHSAGVGAPLDAGIVRAMLAIRVNSLIKGYSGVSEDLISTVVSMLNKNIIPFVPSIGSVGASGDLAPLAHIALAVMGKGEVLQGGERMPSIKAFQKSGIKPHMFLEKEGVAFINGTTAITSILALQAYRCMNLINIAVASSLLFFEAMKGNESAFTDWAVESRRQKGQKDVAAAFRALLSDRPEEEKNNPRNLQDPYTIRCIPQVYGAVLDTIRYCTDIAENEMNSVTDNPLIHNMKIISAGNFHGEPVAFASDFLGIAMTDFGNMLERQIARMIDSNLSGLPPFLTNDSGLNSGYMIPQYVAAALCNMNKVLSHPASSDSIPTSANQEDHVSMGMNSALKLINIVDNLESIIAIHTLLSAQAFDLSHVKGTSFARHLRDKIRKRVPFLDADRPPYLDLEKVRNTLMSDTEKIISRMPLPLD